METEFFGQRFLDEILGSISGGFESILELISAGFGMPKRGESEKEEKLKKLVLLKENLGFRAFGPSISAWKSVKSGIRERNASWRGLWMVLAPFSEPFWPRKPPKRLPETGGKKGTILGAKLEKRGNTPAAGASSSIKDIKSLLSSIPHSYAPLFDEGAAGSTTPAATTGRAD